MDYTAATSLAQANTSIGLGQVVVSTARRERLQTCLSRLSDEDRLLVKQCYGEQRTAVEVAQMTGLSEDAIYTRLSRIRKRLYQCVNSFMRQSGDV